MTFNEIAAAVLLAASGGGAVAVGVVRAFGTRWLDSKFEGRLQALRHEHDRQMEDLRLETSRSLDWSTRLTEREFEVAAEAWSLVFDTYVYTLSALPGFRRYPDFSRTSDEAARHVAEAAGLDPLEIDELMKHEPRERNTYYADRMDVHLIFNSKKAIREASNYLAKKALFLEKNVHLRLKEFVDEAWSAITDREFVHEMRGQGPLPEGIKRSDEAFRSSAEAKIKELEQLVRSRFWPHDPTALSDA